MSVYRVGQALLVAGAYIDAVGGPRKVLSLSLSLSLPLSLSPTHTHTHTHTHTGLAR